MTVATPPSSPAAAGTPPARSGHHFGVHGFRGICVVAVFVFHVINSGLLPAPTTAVGEWLNWFAHGTRYGVELFFMISGYVIVQSLRRHATVGSFLIDRVLRIFPLWLPLALLMLLGYWGAEHFFGAEGSRAYSSLPILLGSLVIAAPVFPLVTIHPAQWSLSYELCFYALASLVWTIGGRRSHGWKLALCWLPALLLPVLYPRALFFAPGVIVAFAEPWLMARARALKWGWIGLFPAWYCWMLTGAEIAGPNGGLARMIDEGHGAAVAIAFLGALCFFAWLVVHRRDGGTIIGSRVVQWLGSISFSFYLVHPLAMPIVKRGVLPLMHLSGWPAVFVLAALAFPLACLGSWMTWYWLEGKLARSLKSIVRRSSARQATAPAAGLP